jgi:hypothetical protein
MKQHLAEENRLDIARRLYNAMRIQHPGRIITLVDPYSRVLACSDRRVVTWKQLAKIP